jgi:hypothetical protein
MPNSIISSYYSICCITVNDLFLYGTYSTRIDVPNVELSVYESIVRVRMSQFHAKLSISKKYFAAAYQSWVFLKTQ